MPETYSKTCQISKIMRHIENAGQIKTVYSGSFKYIQGHFALFSLMLRHIQGH